TFPGYDLSIWQSIVAPAGTPRDVVTKLHGSVKKVLTLPEVREKLLTAGIEPASSNTPEEFAAFIRSQADTRAKVIQAVGMKLDSPGRWRIAPSSARSARCGSGTRTRKPRPRRMRRIIPTGRSASSYRSRRAARPTSSHAWSDSA